MDTKIADIINRMKGRESPNAVTTQTSDLAEVMALVAEEQAQSAAKLERFTRWLVRLTVALIFIGLVQIILMVFGH
jgi:hypothetical protein